MPTHAGRIALINLEGDLEVIAADGTGRRQLTSGDRFFVFPAWSPDAQRIAAIGRNRLKGGVFVFDFDAFGPSEPSPEQTVYESTRNAPIYLYWSPNSQYVSYLAMRGAERSMGLHLAAVNKSALKEGAQPQLITTGQPCFWEWTTDGTQIIAHVGGWDERGSRLTMINPFEHGDAARAPIAKPGLFQAPGIAPSGRYRAFGQWSRKKDAELLVEEIDGDGRITIQHSGVAAISWSPTRDQLAFISPPGPVRTYYGPLKLVEAESGDCEIIGDDVVLAFFWSPDGDKIAYFTVAQIADAVADVLPDPGVLARDGGAQVRLYTLTPGPENEDVDPTPEQLSDEEAEVIETSELWLNVWVVDVHTHESSLIATFEPVDRFVNEFLPFFDQYAKSHRIWAPDSSAVVLPMMKIDDAGQRAAQICVVPVDPTAGGVRRVGDGLMAFWSPH
jgi:TolB protein